MAPPGLIVENEPTAAGHNARTATVFLTGRECPWRCAMCDLWQHTIVADTPRGAIPAQLRTARDELREQVPSITQFKLYNAGSFFDPRAVPEADYDDVAVELADVARVIVESHPALIGSRVDRLLEALRRHGTVNTGTSRLEVAMGLETVHPEALERLNKRMTVDEFAAAADQLHARGVALRAFLLISPPFVQGGEQDEWLLRSIDAAFACGASMISIIPSRTGNGAMEALSLEDAFCAPRLEDIERSIELALRTRSERGPVVVDLWDLQRFADCPECFDSRRARLHDINLRQRVGPETVVPGVRLRHGVMTIHVDVDVAVIGSGFAGSLVSLALTRCGRRVAMIERGRHPRFAIGESSTPLTNLLLEELADRYQLPRLRPFSKWGTWQRERPEVAGGLKRGFSFFFHRPGESFADDREHRRQLLVAASPRDEVADTHWYRPDFDQALARDAESEGTIVLDDTRLDRMRMAGDRAIVEGIRDGRSVRISAGFVVDASGPRGFLHRLFGDDDPPLRWLPPTQGLYAHFTDVARWDQLMPSAETPPYPPDDAALHHVFPGGWIWMLRFNNGITSAGAALTDPVAQAVRAGDGTAAWERLLETLPSVRDQFGAARMVHPFVHAPRVGFRSRVVVGEKWAMLPSAAGVIDPLLSTGFPLTLLGIGRLLDVLDSTSGGAEREAALSAYAQVTQLELDATEQLVAALYANMSDVPLFKRLSLLYFAAASFSEAARRLGRPELAPGFLLHAHPVFGPELRACAALALTTPQGHRRDLLLDRIDRAIEPFDIAGLLDRTRRDWYPVLSEDILGSAAKLDSTVEDIHRLLERCGLLSAGTANR